MSRALDEEVAKKVMGWVTDVDLLDFHPSDTIADAWEVVEKMRGRGFLFFLSADAEDGGWAASFEKDVAEFVRFSRLAPEAICRAALEAVKS